MVSKNQIKFITSLRLKKFREQHQLFTAEGPKVIEEFVRAGWKLHTAYTTESLPFLPEANVIDEKTLQKISSLKTPNKTLALFHKPEEKTFQPPAGELTVALDAVSDPGNLGTIIRLCDWFGVGQLICGIGTVDCFNHKVVQAAMGSLARVQVHYTDLKQLFETQADTAVLGTFMEGENLYKTQLPAASFLVLGNEANGISKTIESLVSQKIAIPRYGRSQQTESLNVATAAAIILGEWRRRE